MPRGLSRATLTAMASQLDTLTKRPLSGPLASRSLTSQSGRMKTASRSLRRQGYMRAASDMAMGAEMAKLNDIAARGGRNIRSADEESSIHRAEVRAAAAAAMQRERSQMPEAGGIGVRGTGVQGASGVEGATSSVGGTAGQGYRSEVAGRARETISKNGWDQPAPPATQPAGSIKIDAGGAAPGPAIPPLLRRPEAPQASRTGSIDGVDVGDKASVIAQVRENATTDNVTRGAALERINKQRASVGQKPIEIDWAKDVAPLDIAAGEQRVADRVEQQKADRRSLLHAKATNLRADLRSRMEEQPPQPEAPAAPQPPPLLERPPQRRGNTSSQTASASPTPRLGGEAKDWIGAFKTGMAGTQPVMAYNLLKRWTNK